MESGDELIRNAIEQSALPGTEAVREGERGYRIKVKESAGYCDFCGGEPVADYDCADFTFGITLVVGKGSIMERSTGDCRACAGCASLIDAKDELGLKMRCVSIMQRNWPDTPAEIFDGMLGSFQGGFWKSLRGKRA